MDAQIAYQFTDKLGVTLEGINLTEEDQSQYLQYKNLPFTFDSGSDAYCSASAAASENSSV